jgi:hypothetical protein
MMGLREENLYLYKKIGELSDKYDALLEQYIMLRDEHRQFKKTIKSWEKKLSTLIYRETKK